MPKTEDICDDSVSGSEAPMTFTDRDGPMLETVLSNLGLLFPDPLFLVDETDGLVWMNLAMADRMCRDNALEPDYAVEWLLSQLDEHGEDIIADGDDPAPLDASSRLVGLADMLGRPEWLRVRVSEVPAGDATYRLIALQDVSVFKQEELNLRDANTLMSHALHHDHATGLFNRSALEDVLAARDDHVDRALLLFEFSGYRAYLASSGAAAAERAIERLSSDLVELIDDEMIVARVAEDRIALLAVPAGSEESLKKRATSIAQHLLNHALQPVGRWPLQIRAVVALEGDLTVARTSLLAEAEATLATMPELSMHQPFEIRIDAGETAARRKRDARLRADLEDAVETSQIEPYFQPILDHERHTVHAFEAFARWRHPEIGLIPPPLFLPVAHDAGYTQNFDISIVRRALAAAARWGHDGAEIGLNLNISPVSLADDAFVEEFLRLVADSDVDPKRITVEKAAAPLPGVPSEPAAAAIARLREQGLSFALDSTAWRHFDPSELFALKPDLVKLSPQAVACLVAADSDLSLNARCVRSFLSIAQAEGAMVAAVGVQENAQVEVLSDLGISHMQGHWLARPMQQAVTEKWLNAQTKTVKGTTALNPA